MICPHCHKQLKIDIKSISFRAECPYCLSYLHCCLNCRFYDSSKSNSCLEPEAEWVIEKDQSNFCEYFEPISVTISAANEDVRQEAVKKFNALFKNK